jgi:hypothetical protein
LISVSVMPSERYSALRSPVALTKGRIAMERNVRGAALRTMVNSPMKPSRVAYQPAARAASVTTMPVQKILFRRRSAGASNESDVDVPTARRANERSPADWKRSSFFFSRQRWMTRAISYGISFSDTVKTSGLSVRMAERESMTVPRMNAGLPVTIS